MEHTTMISRFRAAALILAVAPVLAACSGMVTDDKMGTAVTTLPNGSVDFIRYAAIGTSLGAGIESGGILDSTQRETYTYQLALAMGLTPGANWFYPSLGYPGCPAPYTNILTGARLNGASATGCALRASGSSRPYESNTSIPSLRAYQAIKVDSLNPAWAASDTLKLAQFMTGSISPVTMVVQQGATFVTIEVGGNDVLAAATRGDTTFLTPVAAFTSAITAISDSLTAYGITDAAMANIPNVTSIPHFTAATVLFCLKTGACPGIPATLPYSSPLFTVDASCAPNAVGGIGDNYLLPFPTTGAITNTLAASRAAKVDCARDSALVAVAATPLVATVPAGATINALEFAAISARVTALNGAIQTLATSKGYALADLNAALAAVPTCTTPSTPAVCKPAIPFFTAPSVLFGPVFSLDGVHPTRLGYRLMAQTFAAAINAKYGSTLNVP
jgi:lysophospholipase L1-like esterase